MPLRFFLTGAHAGLVERRGQLLDAQILLPPRPAHVPDYYYVYKLTMDGSPHYPTHPHHKVRYTDR